MGISQPQNLRSPPIERLCPYGIRVSLPLGDPFRKLLGPDWQRQHWYPTPAERDAALAEMSRRHERSEEHTSELQSQSNLVCRLLLEKKKKHYRHILTLATQSSAHI